ncbi:hypothetical protein [Pseudovibrio sp. Ad37]|uniref:hypothetical protein n=1 Tax=Pseudovibrio sp. Ad37 TaxID=989422 RepID=UPI0007AEA13C|nr:hypothetical protein [Pseudovibrio sp. Ad37]KZL19713.1 hypothetical protein PsAD37_03702 [Pseudovibrio sp. Ad37]
MLAGDLAWHLLIKPLGWDKYLPSIEWSEVFGAFSWDGWIPKVDWGMLFGAVKWPDELTNFDWRKFVKEINWLKVMGMGVPTAINTIVEKFTGIDLFEIGQNAIKTLWDGMSSKVGQMVDDIKSRLVGMIPEWMRGESGGDKGSGQNVQARASGGSYRSGPLLVGERGPELKYANEGGYIAHNDNLKRMVRMSDRIRKAARIGAVAGAIAAPMPSVAAAAPILPGMPAAMAPAATTGPKFEISIQFGNITTTDPDIGNVIEEAVANALGRAMTDAQNLLSD